jgi:hypothetical protein
MFRCIFFVVQKDLVRKKLIHHTIEYTLFGYDEENWPINIY